MAADCDDGDRDEDDVNGLKEDAGDGHDGNGLQGDDHDHDLQSSNKLDV